MMAKQSLHRIPLICRIFSNLLGLFHSSLIQQQVFLATCLYTVHQKIKIVFIKITFSSYSCFISLHNLLNYILKIISTTGINRFGDSSWKVHGRVWAVYRHTQKCVSCQHSPIINKVYREKEIISSSWKLLMWRSIKIVSVVFKYT